MDLMKFTGTNSVEHWVNPTKVTRITFSPQTQVPIFPPQLPGDPEPIPTMQDVPASLTVHLDNGFAIQVADEAQDIVDKINKVL